MNALKRNAPLLLLQPLPLLLFPPALLAEALPLIAIVVALMWGLGWMVWRKRTWALTLSIFIQGLNVIVRVMMLLSNAVSASGDINLASRRPSGLRKTKHSTNSLAHRTTWLRSDLGVGLDGVAQANLGFDAEHFYPGAERDCPGDDAPV